MPSLSDATKLRLLLEISSQIHTQMEQGVDLGGALDLVLSTLARLVGYDKAWISLSEPVQGLQRVLVRNAEQEPLALANPESNDEAGLESSIEAPVIYRDHSIGSIKVGLREGGKYSTTDNEILRFFARQLSFAVEKALLEEELLAKKKMESELEFARQVQLSLLPVALPTLDGFDVAAASIPAAGVGGDYYDFISLPENNLGLVVADVVGKGISAALIMASFRAFLRAQIRNDYSIATIFRKINMLLKEGMEDNRFVTAVYGVLSVPDRVLTYCNAGHNPPLLVHADGNVETLTRGGPVMGALDGLEYKESRRQLKAGDVLVLYTDGLTEATNEAGAECGTDLLVRAVQTCRPGTAEEMRDQILGDVSSYRGGVPLEDDLTLLLVKAH